MWERHLNGGYGFGEADVGGCPYRIQLHCIVDKKRIFFYFFGVCSVFADIIFSFATESF